MGASASIQLVYEDSVQWFKQYFLSGTCEEDYSALLASLADGGTVITYDDLELWLKTKADTKGEAWKLAMTPQLIKMAHMQTLKQSQKSEVMENKLCGPEDFRRFLLHLFSICILWSHFKHADSWEAAEDVGNELLNFNEFRMAVSSLCLSNAGEEVITAEQMKEDFKKLDVDSSNSISFLEVCNYVSKNFNLEAVWQSAAKEDEGPASPPTEVGSIALSDGLAISEEEMVASAKLGRHLSENFEATQEQSDTVSKLDRHKVGRQTSSALSAMMDEVEKHDATAKFVVDIEPIQENEDA